MNGEKRGVIGYFASISWAYEYFQRIIGGDKTRKFFVDNYIKSNPYDKVLDFGCGTGKISKLLNKVDYVALEPNKKYHSQIKKNVDKTDNNLILIDSENDLTQFESHFDIIIISGVIHHLLESEVDFFLKKLKSLVKNGGRMVTIDPVIRERMGFFNKLLHKLDRGNMIIPHAEFEKILSRNLEGVSFFYESNMGFPFAYWQCISIYRRK